MAEPSKFAVVVPPNQEDPESQKCSVAVEGSQCSSFVAVGLWKEKKTSSKQEDVIPLWLLCIQRLFPVWSLSKALLVHLVGAWEV